MMLATRLERVAKETTCLQARLEEQAETLRTCQSERARLEQELEARAERIAALEARLDELSQRPVAADSTPSAVPLPPPTEPVVSAKSGGLLGRFKRGKKAEEVSVGASAPVEPEPEPLEEPDASPAPTEPSAGPAIVAKRFAPQEFLSRLPDLDDTQLDLLNFGVTQLDDEGIVVAINHRECDCIGIERADALDRDYFADVLATADGMGLRKKLCQGAVKGKLDTPVLTVLNEGEATVRAIVHLYRHIGSKTNWALIRRESDGK